MFAERMLLFEEFEAHMALHFRVAKQELNELRLVSAFNLGLVVNYQLACSLEKELVDLCLHSKLLHLLSPQYCSIPHLLLVVIEIDLIVTKALVI